MAIHQRITEGERLSQTDERQIQSGVAVGVIFTHDVADDTSALLVRFVRLHAFFIHAIDDAALNRLEAVADIGDGAAYDDGHRIIEEGGPDFACDVAVGQAWDDAADGGFFPEHRVGRLPSFVRSGDGLLGGFFGFFFFFLFGFFGLKGFLFFFRHLSSSYQISRFLTN